MAIVTRGYHVTFKNLFQFNFEQDAVGAQLASNAYAYDAAHQTLADIEGFSVGDSIQLANKTITIDASFNTVISFDDLSYASQGVLQARYVLIHFGVGISTDRLIGVIDLDDTAQNQEISSSIKLATNGLISIPFALPSNESFFGFDGSNDSCTFNTLENL